MTGIERRIADLERAAHITDSGECTCPNVPGTSGLRVTYGYQEPQEATAEDLERVREKSDAEERCRMCGRVRPTLRVLFTKQWRTKD